MPRIQVQRGTGVSRLGVAEASHRVATNIQFTPYPNDICKELGERLIIGKFIPKIEDRIREQAEIMFRAMKTESRMPNKEVYQRLIIGILKRLYIYPDSPNSSDGFQLKSEKDVDRLLKESINWKSVKWEDLFTSETPAAYKVSDLIRELKAKYTKNLSLDSLDKRLGNINTVGAFGFMDSHEMADGIFYPTIQSSDKSGKIYWADLTGLDEEERKELTTRTTATLSLIDSLAHSLLINYNGVKDASSYEELIDVVKVSIYNEDIRKKCMDYILNSKSARELVYNIVETYDGDIESDMINAERERNRSFNFSSLSVSVGVTRTGKWEYVPNTEDSSEYKYQYYQYMWYSCLLGCDGDPYVIEVETNKGVYTIQNPVDVVIPNPDSSWRLSSRRAMEFENGEIIPLSPYKSIFKFTTNTKPFDE